MIICIVVRLTFNQLNTNPQQSDPFTIHYKFTRLHAPLHHLSDDLTQIQAHVLYLQKGTNSVQYAHVCRMKRSINITVEK